MWKLPHSRDSGNVLVKPVVGVVVCHDLLIEICTTCAYI